MKKRACRYLLQRYLGQFLQEKISLEQLSVNLYSGKGEVKDLLLDAEVRNVGWMTNYYDDIILTHEYNIMYCVRPPCS